ncbi:hypothetical protein D0864_17093, partial [Hortaea werneckii]
CRYRYRSGLRCPPPGCRSQPISPWPALLLRHSGFRLRRSHWSVRPDGCYDVQVRVSALLRRSFDIGTQWCCNLVTVWVDRVQARARVLWTSRDVFRRHSGGPLCLLERGL